MNERAQRARERGELFENFSETPEDFHRHSQGIRRELQGKSCDLLANSQGFQGKFVGDLVRNL